MHSENESAVILIKFNNNKLDNVIHNMKLLFSYLFMIYLLYTCCCYLGWKWYSFDDND